MKRRSFLTLLGGASALTAAPGFLRAQALGLGGGTAASERITVGFIGLGGISDGHLQWVLDQPSLQLTWLCDVDRIHLNEAKQRAASAYAAKAGTSSYEGLKTSADFRDVMSDPGVDIIFNCTPDHWHALPLIAAAKAGKDIYSEKPLSRTAAEGEAMVEAVRRAGTVCQIGSQQRSSPEFLRAISLARNGFLGRVQRVQVGLPSMGGMPRPSTTTPQEVPPSLDYERWVGPAPMLPYFSERVHFHWRWRYEFAGGQLTDWINHHYDIAQLALGVSDAFPVAVRQVSGEFHPNPIYNTASRYAFQAEYAGGQVIEVSSDNPMGLRIEGSEGWVFVNRGVIEHSSTALRSVPMPSNGFQIGGGTADHRANFLACVRSRQVPRSPIDQAHKTAMVAHLANAALRSGRSELRYDPERRQVSNAPDAERFLSANYRGPWILSA